MDDHEIIEDVYKKMYEGMVNKDEALLQDVLDDSYVLVHMTGMHQSKEEFITAVMNGTLNYYSSKERNISVKLDGNFATVIGQSEVRAAVFGGRKHTGDFSNNVVLRKQMVFGA